MDMDIAWDRLEPIASHFRALEKLIRKTQGDPQQWGVWARALVEKGRLHARKGENGEARRDYLSVLGVRQRMDGAEGLYQAARATVNLGILSLRENDATQAKALWRQTIKEFSPFAHGLLEKAVFKAWVLLHSQEPEGPGRDKLDESIRQKFGSSPHPEVQKAFLDYLLGHESPFEEEHSEPGLLIDLVMGSRATPMDEAAFRALENAWTALDRLQRKRLIEGLPGKAIASLRDLLARSARGRALFLDEEAFLWRQFPETAVQVLPLASLASLEPAPSPQIFADFTATEAATAAALWGAASRSPAPEMRVWEAAADEKGVRRVLWIDSGTLAWVTGRGELYIKSVGSDRAARRALLPGQVKAALVLDGGIFFQYWDPHQGLGFVDRASMEVSDAGFSGPLEAVSADSQGNLYAAGQGQVLRRSGRGFEPVEGAETARALTVLSVDRAGIAGADQAGHCFFLPAGAKTPWRWTAHKGAVTSMVLRGTLLLTGGEDQWLRVWDLAGKQDPVDPSAEFELDSPVLDIQWSGQGAAAAISARKLVRLDPSTGQGGAWETAPGIQSLSLSPDGRLLLLGDNQGRIRRVDPAAGKEELFKVHGNWVFSLAWSSDGRRWASAGLEGSVFWWKEDSSRPEGFEGRAQPHGLLWLDQARLVCVHPAHLELYMLADGASEPARRFMGSHGGFIGAWCRNESTGQLLTADVTGLVRLWDALGLPAGEIALDSPVLSLAWVGPERWIAGCQDGALRIFLMTGDERHPFRMEKQLQTGVGPVHELAVTSEGRVVCAGDEPDPEIWDPEKGRLMARLFQGHRKAISSLALTGDGNLLTASEDGQLLLWSLEGRLLDALQQERAALRGLKTRGLVAAGRDGDKDLTIFYLSRSPEGESWPAHKSAVTTIEFSPRGGFLATGSRDRTIRLWRLPEGRFSQKLTGLDEEVHGLAFSPDGRLIAGAGRNGRIVVWDLQGTLAAWDRLPSLMKAADAAGLAWEDYLRTIGFQL